MYPYNSLTPTRHQLYGHMPPITKTIQVRQARHAGHCWRSRDELIRDVLLWTPTHGRANAGRPARTYIHQLYEDTGCCPEDLPRAMNDREEWRERVRDIRATSATWWWWWWYRKNRYSLMYPYNSLTPTFPKRIFIELMELATKSLAFSFNDTMYRQDDEISMGSPLHTILDYVFGGFWS